MAVSGVVASLSLAVALTVMVASFRDSVTHWLDVVLPADLYVRAAMGTGAADTVFFPPELALREVAACPGVKYTVSAAPVPTGHAHARSAMPCTSSQCVAELATITGSHRGTPRAPAGAAGATQATHEASRS